MGPVGQAPERELRRRRRTFAGGSPGVHLLGRRPPADPFLELFQKVRQTPGVPPTSDLERMIRGAELRVTGPRLAVLSAVHAHPHADTDSLIRAVRADRGEVSHQAVYDVLRA